MQSFSKGILLIIFFLVITSVILFVKEQTKKKKKNNDKNNGSLTINDQDLTRRNLGAGLYDPDYQYQLRFTFTTPTSYGDVDAKYQATLFYIVDNPTGSPQPDANPTIEELQNQTYFKSTAPNIPFIPENYISGDSSRPTGTQLTVDIPTDKILTGFNPAATNPGSYYLGIAVASDKKTVTGYPVFGPFTYTIIKYDDPSPPLPVGPFTATLTIN
jgi:hypothetical protein